ncbi:hypothetical protein Ct9H90mP29_08150 [bacterium]|nr:MAG: hypothetical protein Ct9H90mP29_08150 [bacterium]
MEALTEYFLEIEFRLKKDKGLLKAGHLVAWEQLPIVNYATIKTADKIAHSSFIDNIPILDNVVESDKDIIIVGNAFRVVFSKVKGTLGLGQKMERSIWQGAPCQIFGGHLR